MFEHRINDSLVLRIYEERHADEVFAVIDLNRAYLVPWLPWVEKTTTVDDVRTFIRKGLEQFSKNDGFHAGIWENGQYVGGIGLHWIDWTNSYTEIGYWLAEKSQGRGIMTSACRAVVDHAFKEWKLNKVEIRAATGNIKSREVPKRLGFKEEATIRQVSKLGSGYHDLVVYGILASEWKG